MFCGVYFIWSIVLSNPSNMELFSCSKSCNCCSDNVDSNWCSASISLFLTFDGTPLSGLNLGGGRLTILKSNILLQRCIPLTFLHFSHQSHFLLIPLYVQCFAQLLT